MHRLLAFTRRNSSHRFLANGRPTNNLTLRGNGFTSILSPCPGLESDALSYKALSAEHRPSTPHVPRRDFLDECGRRPRRGDGRGVARRA